MFYFTRNFERNSDVNADADAEMPMLRFPNGPQNKDVNFIEFA